jgi:hypothetical protein
MAGGAAPYVARGLEAAARSTAKVVGPRVRALAGQIPAPVSQAYTDVVRRGSDVFSRSWPPRKPAVVDAVLDAPRINPQIRMVGENVALAWPPRLDGRAGTIDYGTVDALGRPTGVQATLTHNMIGTGTKANPTIFPPGWRGNGLAFNEARGHLLGRQLGGSGDVAENLVTLQQWPANSPFMRKLEKEARRAVEGGQVVGYSSTPLYSGRNLVPRGITLKGVGSDGFDMYVTILNPPGY